MTVTEHKRAHLWFLLGVFMASITWRCIYATGEAAKLLFAICVSLWILASIGYGIYLATSED